MLYQAVMTKKGAEVVGNPEMQGETVDYKRLVHARRKILDVSYNGKKIASGLTYEGPGAECRLVNFPEVE